VAARPPVWLQQDVAIYDTYLQRIVECDQALEQHLKGGPDKVADTAPTDGLTPGRHQLAQKPELPRRAVPPPRGKLGAPKAITAMAHKLARLVYRMLKWGHEYVDKGLTYYEARHREQQVQLLQKRAREARVQLVEPQKA
jgi:hypothetical protein